MGNFLRKPDQNTCLAKPNDDQVKENIEEESPIFLNIPRDIKPDYSTAEKNEFSVLSYNILADCFSSHLSKWSHHKFLDFNYRSKIIVDQIRRLSPDILFLQEVDNLTRFYKKHFVNLGYELIFREKSTLRGEGCLIGFKSDIFGIIAKEFVDLDASDKPMASEFKRGGIAVVAKLRHKIWNKSINVICTHFYWDPKFEHVKYFQMANLLKFIESRFDSEDIIIWGGDLNAKPNDNLVKYILKHNKPELKRMEIKNNQGLEIMQELYHELEAQCNKFELANPYEYYGKASGNSTISFPKYTNFTADFKGTIDHIFFTKKNLVATKLLKIPDESEIKNKSLPNRKFPSDHLPIMAVFELCI